MPEARDNRKVMDDETAEDIKRHFNVVAEGLRSDIRLVIEGLGANTDRLDHLEGRFDGVEIRFDGVEMRFERLRTEFRELGERIEPRRGDG